MFGLVLATSALGRWNIDMARHSRERQHPADYLRNTYYENWLSGLERLLVESGLVSDRELAAGEAKDEGDPEARRRMLHAQDIRRVSAGTSYELEADGAASLQGRRQGPRSKPSPFGTHGGGRPATSAAGPASSTNTMGATSSRTGTPRGRGWAATCTACASRLRSSGARTRPPTPPCTWTCGKTTWSRRDRTPRTSPSTATTHFPATQPGRSSPSPGRRRPSRWPCTWSSRATSTDPSGRRRWARRSRRRRRGETPTVAGPTTGTG